MIILPAERGIAPITRNIEIIENPIRITAAECGAFADFLNDDPLTYNSVKFAATLHRNVKRKLGDGFEIDHVIETAFYVHRALSQHPNVVDNPNIVISGALLHDAFEQHEHHNPIRNPPTASDVETYLKQGLTNHDDLVKAAEIVDLAQQESPIVPTDEVAIEYYNNAILTIPGLQRLTSKEFSEERLWRRRKRADMVRILETVSLDLDYLRPYLLIIKIADIMANACETVRDIKAGLDNDDTNTHIAPAAWRYRMFVDRVRILDEFIKRDYSNTQYEPLFTSMLKDLRMVVEELGPLVQ